MKFLLFSVLLLACAYTNASTAVASNVNVEDMSMTPDSGQFLVKTSVMPTGLDCTTSHWMTLSPGGHPGYDVTISMLMAAKFADKTVTVTAIETGTGNICELFRVVID